MPGSTGKILVVDDDPVVLRAVTEILRRDGHEVTSMSSPVEALLVAKDPSIDVVVSDFRMPGLSGLEVLKAFKTGRADVEVIIMTGHATIETAIEAVQLGAFTYLQKPFERIEDFSLAVTRALERRNLRARAETLEEALSTTSRFEGIIGHSAQMQAVFKLVEAVSLSTASVLIQGESGTGKELVAKAIHVRGPRRGKPFIAVNCSALTDTLLDSELFGHLKGAFTGAIANKKGLFEAANEGTLFLDEIGDIAPATQVRLLRVLQEGEVKPVGANESKKVDVRVIAATNVDLRKAMADNTFRTDLYYRLKVVGVQLPPLRDRPGDIPLLAQHFVEVHARKASKKVEGIDRAGMELLTLHPWVGNVRELEHAVERAVVLSQRAQLGPEDFALETQGVDPSRSVADFPNLTHLPYAEAKALVLEAFGRRYLTVAMERSGGNVTQGALAAGMDRSNFRRLLREHGLSSGGDGAEAKDEPKA